LRGWETGANNRFNFRYVEFEGLWNTQRKYFIGSWTNSSEEIPGEELQLCE
jgi:hypothetical protein